MRSERNILPYPPSGSRSSANDCKEIRTGLGFKSTIPPKHIRIDFLSSSSINARHQNSKHRFSPTCHVFSRRNLPTFHASTSIERQILYWITIFYGWYVLQDSSSVHTDNATESLRATTFQWQKMTRAKSISTILLLRQTQDRRSST
jgi:hypothetical protein